MSSENTWGRLAAAQFGGGGFSYQYSYNTAGRVTSQRLQYVPHTNIVTGQPQAPVNFDVNYAWDNEGGMTLLQYPGDAAQSTSWLTFGSTFTYDSMGRPSNMNECWPSAPNGYLICGGVNAGASWDASGNLTSFNGDTRTYNNLGQLTRMTQQVQTGWQGATPVYSTLMDLQYVYTAGQNNGRVAQIIDGVTGEQTSYTYDTLNRLSAAWTANGSWGNAYTYDGWGNLTNKTVTQGTAPSYSQNYDPSLNQPAGTSPPSVTPQGYNLDVEGRPLIATWPVVPGGGGSAQLMYDGSGKRVFATQTVDSGYGDGNTDEVCELYLYGITGKKLVTYRCGYSEDANAGDSGNFYWYEESRSVYFLGKPVVLNGVQVVTDRLGSVRANGNNEKFAYFPYGEERTSTPDRREKFGTYFRDPGNYGPGLDYADQRYYSSASGSFTMPDRMGVAGANPSSPGSWNRYAYVQGDPVNFKDPRGRFALAADDDDDDGENDGGEGFEPSPPIQQTTPSPINKSKSNFPECNPSGSAQEDANLAFVLQNYSAASQLAKLSGVNAIWLLGWAAEESGYGSSNKANLNGNYVNESLPPGSVTGGWTNAVQCPSDASKGWACFSGFFDSVYSALYTQHGTWSTPGASGLSVIDSFLAANPNATEAQVFQAVADAGFDPPGTSTNAGYGDRTQTVTRGVQRRVDCLTKNGYR